MISRKPLRRCVGKALLLFVALFAVRAPATAAEALGPVGLVKESLQDARAEEVQVRIRSELTASGMAWVTVDGSADVSRSPLGPPWALVFVASTQHGVAVDIALPSRNSGGTTARRLIQVGVSSTLTPVELALRTVEVLRAHVAAGPPARFESSALVKVPLQVPVGKPPPISICFALGIAGLVGRDGLQPGVGPAAGVAFVAPRWWGARLLGGSSLLRGNANGADLAVDVKQELLTADAMLFLRHRQTRARPYVFAGGGVFALQASAKPDERLIAKPVSRWAGAAVAGAGVSVGGDHVRLVAEAKLIFTAPSFRVQAVGPSAGAAGKPSGLAMVAVSWAL